MNSTHTRRILVLDGDMVPALTISRSLARRGCAVDTASHIEKPITGRSNSIRQVYQYPDPLTQEKAFLEWLVDHCGTFGYDLVIPVTERSLVPISNFRHLLQGVHIAMPSAKSLELALDKEQTVALARSLGVPVPAGVSVSSMEELLPHLTTIKYPVVLKPARSLGSFNGGSSQLKVSYAFDEIELRAGCSHGLKFGPILLQEYFRGKGVGIELIAHEGKVAYAFQHLRLHEVPLTGGGSSLRMSVPIEPRLLEAAENLVVALEWNGVAMVEFKWHAETGDFSLMEINGRFWGSLPLADAAGADFPAMLLDLELDGRIVPCDPYRPGVYCRKLSSDLYWYEAVLRRNSQSRIADIPAGWEIFKGLGVLLSPRHYFDVQSLRDPIPGLVDIGDIIGNYYHRFLALAGEKLFFRRQRRAWRQGQVADAINRAESVLFICYGNINRSALAGELTKSYAEDSGLAVISAGFHQDDGRPVDPVMLEVAAQNGLDLGQLQSTTVTPEMLSSSDVIFVMEKQHVDTLRTLDGASAAKTFLLGAHGGRSGFGPEIADPYGGSWEDYEHCYQRISEAADHIKSILAFGRAD